MDYDGYSSDNNSYDEESNGYDSYDDDVSHYDYDKDENTDHLGDDQDQYYTDENTEVLTSQDGELISRKPYDYDKHDTDDDIELPIYHVVTKSSETPPRKSNVSHSQKSSKPSSELDFDRAITILFNQDLN